MVPESLADVRPAKHSRLAQGPKGKSDQEPIDNSLIVVRADRENQERLIIAGRNFAAATIPIKGAASTMLEL